MRKLIVGSIACLIAGTFFAPGATSSTLFIDPGASTITFSGDVLVFFPLLPQSAGSNVVSFDGTVDLDEAPPGFLTFNGAVADALEQADPQSPLPGGGAGTAPADAGLAIGGIGTVALRGLIISVTGVTPFSPPDFDLNALTLTITSGTLDYAVPSFSLVGFQDLAGTNTMPASGTGTYVGGVLTIPIDVTLVVQVLGADTPEEPDDDGYANVNLVGQFVTVVPEPTSMTLSGIALVMATAAGYRRRYHRS